MNAKDQIKVMEAGFTIIRADLHQLIIKAKDKRNPNWVTWERGFKTKAALLRRMKTALQNDYTIED